MSNGGQKTETVAGPFRLRLKARAQERRLTRIVKDAQSLAYYGKDQTALITLRNAGLPEWARGVKVEPIGRLVIGRKRQFVVVATEWAGH